MNYDKIDGYLVDIFNNVVIIEEASLKNSKFNDVSLKEMHTIDVIGTHPDTTPSAVAKELMLTLGTVTTSLNKLEKKGYIVRTRSSVDRRVVHLSLSKKMCVPTAGPTWHTVLSFRPRLPVRYCCTGSNRFFWAV